MWEISEKHVLAITISTPFSNGNYVQKGIVIIHIHTYVETGPSFIMFWRENVHTKIPKEWHWNSYWYQNATFWWATNEQQ